MKLAICVLAALSLPWLPLRAQPDTAPVEAGFRPASEGGIPAPHCTRLWVTAHSNPRAVPPSPPREERAGERRHPLPSAPTSSKVLCSGARPSPGAATSARRPGPEHFNVPNQSKLATPEDRRAPGEVYPIDLPTALHLAGARNLDIQIARERLNEARANRQSALEQFFPWIAPGVGYHRRDGVAQSVPSGVISDAHFQSYSPGVTLTAQMALGDAIYNSLATRQLVEASDQALESQRQDTILSAAQGYFDLVKGRALVEVVKEAIQVSEDYQQQLHQAVASGVVFKGDELRVQSQTEHYRIALEQTLEQERVAGVNLALVLHLDSRIAFAPLDTGLTPLTLFPTNAALHPLVEQALRTRPELKQSQAFVAATRATKNATVYGPLIPSLGAQVFGGGLGGGPDGGPSHFGAEGDYTVGLSWRIGPGGLLDSGRINAGKARLAAARFSDSKLKDAVISEVVAALVRVNSTAAQIRLAERNLATATETLRLTRERKQYGVGIVLEDIQAQQALTQARSDYVTAVAEYGKAQYALNKAVGGLESLPVPNPTGHGFER